MGSRRDRGYHLAFRPTFYNLDSPFPPISRSLLNASGKTVRQGQMPLRMPRNSPREVKSGTISDEYDP